MKLIIMRGVHDLNMVNEVVEQAEKADVIFLEMLGPEKEKRTLMDYASKLSFEEGFAESPAGHFIAEQDDAIMKLIWHLRGKRKFIIAVDKSIDQSFDDYLYGLMKSWTPDEWERFIKKHDPTLLYEYVEAHLKEAAQEITNRDKLVARQVNATIKKITEKGFTVNNILLIQGLLHQSGPWIKELLPDLEQEEILYNIDEHRALNFPYNRALMELLKNPSADLPMHLISQIIYIEVRGLSHRLGKPNLRTSTYDSKTNQHVNLIENIYAEIEHLSPEEIMDKTSNAIKEFLK